MSSMFSYIYNQEGSDRRYPILHPDSYLAAVDYNRTSRIVARTWAGAATHRQDGPFADPDTLWVLEEIVPDPQTVSGFRTRGVTYLAKPDSTEVQAIYTPWLCLSWFVPVGAEEALASRF